MAKVDRILSLKAALLRGTPILDAEGWAAELGVDTRTVQRYLAFLRGTLGLSILYDRDSKGYRTDQPKSVSMDETRKKKRLMLMDLVHRITAEPGKTARELAAEMLCSSRTIYRAVRDLEELGLPVYSDGGYRFLTDAFLPPLGLQPSELLSLFLGVRLLESQGGDDCGPEGRRALEKLVRGLSEQRRPDITALRNSVQVSKTLEDTGVDNLLDLQAVIGSGRQLRLWYLGLYDDQPTERDVDPMGLFGFRQVWYLRAFDHLRGDYRNFRLSRVHTWEQLKTPTKHQAKMELGEVVYHRWDVEGASTVEVRLRVNESLGRWLFENPPHPSQRIEGDQVTYAVSDLAGVSRWAAGLHGLEVLAPADLRELMAKMGAELSQLYAKVVV